MKIKINQVAVFLCAIALFQLAVYAHTPSESGTSTANAPTLAPVTVNANVGGPAMWRVSKDGHVMWVLGIVQVVPSNLTWQSHDVAHVMVHAHELIMPPDAYFRLFFVKWLWWKSAIRGASKNPGRATLAGILPSPMYLRWRMLWRKYGDGNASIERFNPQYAQRKLYHGFLQKTGLQSNHAVVNEIADIARKYNVRITRADYIEHIAHPKQFMMSSAPMSDELACFSVTLDFVEHDLDSIRKRAAAWATGDIQTLRTIRLADRSACRTPLVLTRRYGAGDIPKRKQEAWLAAAQSALERNNVTVALLPMSEVLGKSGYLAALQARGDAVEPPGSAEQARSKPAVNAH